jgi:hypothetical protein
VRYPFSIIVLPDFGQPELKHPDARASVVGLVYVARVVVVGGTGGTTSVVVVVDGRRGVVVGDTVVADVFCVVLGVEAELVDGTELTVASVVVFGSARLESTVFESSDVVVAKLVSATEVVSTTEVWTTGSVSVWLLVEGDVHPTRRTRASPAGARNGRRAFIPFLRCGVSANRGSFRGLMSTELQAGKPCLYAPSGDGVRYVFVYATLPSRSAARSRRVDARFSQPVKGVRRGMGGHW